MSTKHMVFDGSLDFFNGTACTTWTYGSEYAGSVVDLGTAPDKTNPPEIWIDIPGFAAGSSGTMIIKLYGGTTASTATTLLWTSRTYTAAEQALLFDTKDEGYRLPVPIGDLITGTTAIRSLKLSFTIGTATPTAGTCYACVGGPAK